MSNVLADSLSRRVVVRHTEWTLAKEVLLPAWEAWFRPLVDLFCHSIQSSTADYVSPVQDSEAWGWTLYLSRG